MSTAPIYGVQPEPPQQTTEHRSLSGLSSGLNRKPVHSATPIREFVASYFKEELRRSKGQHETPHLEIHNPSLEDLNKPSPREMTAAQLARAKISELWRTAEAERDVQLADITSAAQILIEENEWVPPTQHATSGFLSVIPRTYHLLRSADAERYRNLPDPFIVTDDTGSIRVKWIRNLAEGNRREVRINIGSAVGRRSYIYYESGGLHGVEAVNPSNLSERLSWLLNG